MNTSSITLSDASCGFFVENRINSSIIEENVYNTDALQAGGSRFDPDQLHQNYKFFKSFRKLDNLRRPIEPNDFDGLAHFGAGRPKRDRTGKGNF